MSLGQNSTDRYWLLDDVAGWPRQASFEKLVLNGPDRELVLEALPGIATRLLDVDIETAEFKRPSALASDDRGNALVVDAATNLVKRIDLARGLVTTLPAIGGLGSDPRELREPRGIAVLSSGAVVVSDTGNHHVKIFLPPASTLLQDWGDSDQLGLPRPGQGKKFFRSPWAVAVDPAHAVYVVDRGNRRVKKIMADGTGEEELGGDSWVNPVRLAVGPKGCIAVVDVGANAVVVLAPGARPWSFEIAGARSVTFDGDGKVYVGAADGFVHVFRPDQNKVGSYLPIGAGLTGLDGEIIDLAWDRACGLLAIIRENTQGHRQGLWKINPVETSVQNGFLLTSALDSKMEQCQWHRVLLDVQVPHGTSIQIDSFTAEENRQDEVAGPDFQGWAKCVLAGDSNPDCLVQSGPGRYLWLRLTLYSNGLESPRLRSVKAFYPRASYLRYLPAVYQEDEESRLFLERFLSIFQSEFDALDRRIDRIWQLFSPDSVPAKNLPWLAGWLAAVLNPEWPESQQRATLKSAFKNYLQRGTVAGLQQTIRDQVGVEASVIEHFRLRRWPALTFAAPLSGGLRLWSPDFYQRLQITSYSQIGRFRLISRPEPAAEPFDWGAHQFTVLFVADPYRVKEVELQVKQVVEREKPAHTQATVCPVFPRFRIGIQSTIGTDSVVGGISYLVLNRLATLGYDSILGTSPEEEKLRELGLPRRPQLGRSSLLS